MELFAGIIVFLSIIFFIWGMVALIFPSLFFWNHDRSRKKILKQIFFILGINFFLIVIISLIVGLKQKRLINENEKQNSSSKNKILIENNLSKKESNKLNSQKIEIKPKNLKNNVDLKKTPPDKKINSINSDKFIKRYKSVLDMIDNNFNEDPIVCTKPVKVISNNPLHIQIGPSVLKEDIPEVITGLVKSSIIWVAFYSFATTDVNKIKITSIPFEDVLGSNNSESGKLLHHYGITVNISREKAEKILYKYFNTRDFNILIDYKEGINLPSKKMELITSEGNGQPDIHTMINEMQK